MYLEKKGKRIIVVQKKPSATFGFEGEWQRIEYSTEEQKVIDSILAETGLIQSVIAAINTVTNPVSGRDLDSFESYVASMYILLRPNDIAYNLLFDLINGKDQKIEIKDLAY